MEQSTWKLIAVIAILLLTIETIALIMIYKRGNSIIENENKCFDECYNITNAISWYYDWENNRCYCNLENGDVKRVEV